MLKSQDNCTLLKNANCKKACELSDYAASYQGSFESQNTFDRAIKLCPSYDYAYSEKSVPYLKRGDFVTWKKLIDKAVDIDPKRNLGYRGWCQYQFLRNYRAALNDIEALEQLVGEDNIGFSQNGDYNLQIVKALCYKGMGDNKKAIEIFEKQFSMNDYHVMLFDYYHLGVLYYEQNDIIKARDYFQKQITNSNYFAEPYYYLALIDLKENNKLEAKSKIKKALDLYSKSYFMKDPYTNIKDRIYEEDIKKLSIELDN